MQTATVKDVAFKLLKKLVKKWAPEWLVFVYSKDYFSIDCDATAHNDEFYAQFLDGKIDVTWHSRPHLRFDKVDKYKSTFYYSDPEFHLQFMAELKKWAVYIWEVDGLIAAGFKNPGE